LGQLPLFGRLFSYEKEEVVKTELLIFLRPTIVENASIERDLRQFKQYLPAGEMTSPTSLATQNTPPGERSP
jgi:general secretion pathway protein D